MPHDVPARPLRLLIAGGGTGGHLFPGVAIAEELRAQQPQAAVRFVGTKRGIEARVLPGLGWDVAFIEISGLKTVGAVGALRGLLRLPKALWQSRGLVRDFAPDVVVGVGGYASGPVVLMARVAGIPTAIVEQNSIPGLTNKMLGRVVRAVFLTFSDTARFFSAKKILNTGNPLRRSLVEKLRAAPALPSGEVRHVLICGGSLGAVAVNELASAALIELARGRALSIVHQTGDKGLDTTIAAYKAAGIAADVRPFITDIAAEYAKADVIIARAGATTVAELAIAGKPTIFIPYPHAADNHQEFNARELVDIGAAVMFRQSELTAAALGAEITALLDDQPRRASMTAAMRARAKPDAANKVVAWCVSQVASQAAKQAR